MAKVPQWRAREQALSMTVMTMRDRGRIYRWTRYHHATPWAWAVSRRGHTWAHGRTATWAHALERVLTHLSEGDA